MNTCTRRFEIDAGHRVMNHGGKCRNMHGHRYVIEVTVAAPQLDALGMVIDFSEIKSRIGDWLDREWDHGFLVFKDDIEVIAALALVGGQKVAIVPFNPTAENMATFLYEIKIPELLSGTNATVKRVRVWETPNCSAEAP